MALPRGNTPALFTAALVAAFLPQLPDRASATGVASLRRRWKRLSRPAVKRVVELRPAARSARAGRGLKRRTRRRGWRRSRWRRGRRRRTRCGTRDITVPLKYVHGGRVWIPREAACGGTFPVIVLLHGNNPFGRMNKYVGGGKEIDRIARQYLDGKFIEPVVLAQPIHHAVARRKGRRNGIDLLWGDNFDFKVYRRMLQGLLRRYRIRPKNWSFIGHSGAGCASRAGLFAAAKIWKNIRVWATADTCYGSLSFSSLPKARFAGTNTVIYNACRGAVAYSGYPRYARDLFTSRPVRTACDRTYYKSCIRHPKYPWHSFVTKPKTVKGHSPVVTELIKTILWRHYPSSRRIGRRVPLDVRTKHTKVPKRRVAMRKRSKSRKRNGVRRGRPTGPVIRIKRPPQLANR